MLPYQLITSYTAFSTFCSFFPFLICFNANIRHAFVKWAFHWTYYLPLNGIAIMVLITQLTNFYKIFPRIIIRMIKFGAFFCRAGRELCVWRFFFCYKWFYFVLSSLSVCLCWFFCCFFCFLLFFSTVLFDYYFFSCKKKMQWIIQKVHHFRQCGIHKESQSNLLNWKNNGKFIQAAFKISIYLRQLSKRGHFMQTNLRETSFWPFVFCTNSP